MAAPRTPLVLMAVLFAACGGSGPPAGEDGAAESAEMLERARAFARRTIVLDGHIDVPYRLHRAWEDIGDRTPGGDFDGPRAAEGGLDAAFFSIYVPARYQQEGGARAFADRLIDSVERIAREHADRFAIATRADEVVANAQRGIFSMLLGMENGAPVEGDLSALEHFHRRGVRYITLTHSKDNAIADSSYDDSRTWGGLSPFGRDVVRAMNRLGIIVDVSHISDDAFWDVFEVTEAPPIASHSSCRRFTPGFERNMSDEMIVALAAKGGVIQINFGSVFLRGDILERRRANREHLEAYRREHGLDEDDPEYREYARAYAERHPIGRASVADVADHIEHAVALAGVEHVGLGSDFDGVGDTLPEGLRDVSELPNLFAELMRRGYDEEQLEAIASGNVLRVLREVERIAEGSSE